MDDEKKETVTWKSSASDLENYDPPTYEERVEGELLKKLKLEEENVFNLYQPPEFSFSL